MNLNLFLRRLFFLKKYIYKKNTTTTQIINRIMQFTPISNLGEFKLIKKITANFSKNHESTKSDIGDDSAVLALPSGQDCLISTDMLIEGVHFDITYCPMKHVGYKSIVASVSDICAMNGLAKQVLVSLAIPNKYSVELITDLYDGIRLACKKVYLFAAK